MKAADQGYASSQYNLGLMYARGQGVAQNYAEALKWFRLAADQDDANAQVQIGGMYHEGQGVPKDYATAAHWYRMAAEQGSGPAQASLGSMYYGGRGVRQDYAEASKLFRLAAEQGSAEGQLALGGMYYFGRGVPQDYVRAYMWTNLSAAQGEKLAEKYRDLAASKMTPAQIAEAQELSRDWKLRSPQVARPDHEVAPPSTAPNRNPSSQTRVPMNNDGGISVVPVEINGTMTLDFAIDSGASDVSVPADVFSTLKRAGGIKEADFIGRQTYVLADGSKSLSATFTIRSLRVGNMVVENVRASVAPAQGTLLLGQSFFERFKSWSIDNTKHELLLEPQ